MTIIETFSEEEKKILAPFVTNTDKNVFVLRNLPEVIKGALFSRYSRSAKSLRRLLLDEFIKDPQTGFSEIVSIDTEKIGELKQAVQKAQSFYDRVLDGYGDDSVAELGGAHLACELISNLATKHLEDARIGGSPLEKSTRYVWFNQKINNEFMFYKEPKIMKSRFAKLYLETNNLLFQTYSDLVEPVTKFVEENFPLSEFEFFDIEKKENVKFDKIRDEKLKKRASLVYNSSVRAKSCDITRVLLPASTLTNVGIFGNGRFFQNLLTKLYSQNLIELQGLAKSINEELNYVIPSFVRRAKIDSYLIETRNNMKKVADDLTDITPVKEAKSVSLVHYDKEEDEMIATMLYPYSRQSMKQLIEFVNNMAVNEKKKIIDAYMGNRNNRRNRPGRALEKIYYTFDILADFGIYRDLHRHRILTQERQPLTVIHGYTLPDELIAAGYKKEFVECMDKAKEAYEQIYSEFPEEAQYVVPLAYKVRWYIKFNLREAFHFIELRTSPQGHPSYRKIAQLMYKEIERVHPNLAHYMKFVDMNDYPLGRLKSELRKEEKRELLNK